MSYNVLFKVKAAKQANPALKVIVIDRDYLSTLRDIEDIHLALESAQTWLFNGLLNHLDDNDKLDSNYMNTFWVYWSRSIQAIADCTRSLAGATKALPNPNGADWATTRTVLQVVCFYWESTHHLFSRRKPIDTKGADKVNAIINCHLATRKIEANGHGAILCWRGWVNTGTRWAAERWAA